MIVTFLKSTGYLVCKMSLNFILPDDLLILIARFNIFGQEYHRNDLVSICVHHRSGTRCRHVLLLVMLTLVTWLR